MAKVVRVYFMDNVGYKAFGIDENTNAEKLKTMVTERLGMKEDGCFSIFEKKDGWERCLEPEEKPCELMSAWGATETKKSGGQETLKDAQSAFILKKKIYLRDDDREMLDPVTKHHVYLQALWSVIESEYPCTIEDAIRLAGLQVQIVYGDHKPGSHTAGFLTQNLKNFVPQDLYSLKRPAEWEALIFKAHALNTGKSAEDSKLEYLEIVKQWPFYGTTFYPPCRSVNNRKLPSKVIIGVNAEGILLLKKDKELVSTHPFTEICSWASSSTTFAFEFGTQLESQKYTFETRQGAIIATSIQTYIDILVQMLKSGEESEDEQE